MLSWLKGKKPEVKKPEVDYIPQRRGFLTTDVDLSSLTTSPHAARLRAQNALAVTFQRGIESLKPVAEDGKALPAGNVAHAMDEAFSEMTSSKLINSTGGTMPSGQLEWYALHGFIGWQACAMISQQWLVDKACTMPGDDAVRHGWEISAPEGFDLNAKVLAKIKKLDKRMKIKGNCREYIKMGRIFGVRIALYVVDGVDMELPFNPDGVKPNSYKGISQIDPYWITPVLDARAASDPASMDFYEPTWWQINGRRVHKSHLCIMRNGDEVPDILKPSYFYGGVPTPQKIFERVFAAERSANEVPGLLMTKRMTVMQLDLSQAAADPQGLQGRMELWSALMNNWGVKVIGEADNIQQFDTNLTGTDEAVMTQYQLVSAASSVPATKLLGTTPKGFNSTGENETKSYHEFLESIQENELGEFLEGHYLRLSRSYIEGAPELDIAWKPVDSPTAKEMAEINKIKAETDSALIVAGVIQGLDSRQRLISDADSGYHGLESDFPDDVNDYAAPQNEAVKGE